MSDTITWEDVPDFLDELKGAARNLLSQESNAQSLCATGLVLSAMRRVIAKGQEPQEIVWKNRRYFFGAMYLAMRRALIDHGKKRKSIGHVGRPLQVEDLDLVNLSRSLQQKPDQAQALALALEKMSEAKPDWAELIQHHFFSGMTWSEAGKVMELSERTARRMWERARLSLYSEILGILNQPA